jgi:glycosyltransferase involved in cell wall biosynthesis
MADVSQHVPSGGMRLSAVIPCHDGERYVAEAIRSVLAQAQPAIEVIVVDDGSTDGTPEAVRAFGGAVRYERVAHRGAAAARNHGAGLATGDAIAFLDADDLWTAGALSALAAALTASPAAGMALGRMEQFVSPELPETDRSRFQFSPDPVAARMCGTVLVRRDAFDRVGGFSPRLASGEFIDWYLRAEHLGVRTVTIDQVVLRRRLHHWNHGVTRRDTRQDYLQVVKAALDRRRALEARANPR